MSRAASDCYPIGCPESHVVSGTTKGDGRGWVPPLNLRSNLGTGQSGFVTTLAVALLWLLVVLALLSAHELAIATLSAHSGGAD